LKGAQGGESKFHLGRMFALMGSMYSWATKEYLLWEMSLDQFMLYLVEGIELKYPTENNNPDEGEIDISKMDANQILQLKQDLRNKYGAVGG
jgi:hypothetical protein